MVQQYCPLRQWVIEDSNKPVISLNGKKISRLMLDTWVEQYRDYLNDSGLDVGDRFLVVTENPLTSVILIIACLRSGFIYCPANHRFPLQQIEAYGNRIGSRFTLGVFLENATELQLPELIDEFSQNPAPIKIETHRLFNLIATSGTTGVPKAVAHTFSNHWCSAEGSKANIDLKEGDSWLLSLPLFHVGGFSIVIRCLLAGATMVIDTEKTSLANLLMQEKVTHLSLVNTQLYRLINHEGFHFSKTQVNLVLLGGGYASEEVVSIVENQGVQLLTTYGLTEMSSQVTTGKPCFMNAGVTSGKPLPYRELAINEADEICVRGETLAAGYYSDGSLSSLLATDGWFHTGDLGCWYQGNLKVTGRRDNMMISGGENIHPEEIEQALLSLDGIVQAVVVSIAHQEYGSRPYAFVETENDRFDPLFTKRMLAGNIGRLKVPDVIRLLPAEYSGIGIKPDRRLLQALARSDSGY
ncbi:o-succinylbenzoate--CoA ligase [Endozoicomonas sp. OPT23]|uniref:o-succinylbenzoate--CoA ligase n=1 Tax=Endozoicomonas sp. OPT23 TaxID=2072845 RepID=UPI00129BEBBC|nr:o-succinylbenzoate--CoA ligase [Endozoicomonas sp. OPT23]MRI34727.1 o-succinylbenzoate--CoA ligase [Endozoicomonas sp. OPT23]